MKGTTFVRAIPLYEHFPLCVLFVFLVHSAEYESWSLPLAILIAPMCLPFALFGTWLRGMDDNLITQIGFIVLVGLAAKNAVLIVEFAKQQHEGGKDRFAAAVEASRLRLRPVMMTSLPSFSEYYRSPKVPEFRLPKR